MGSESNAEKNLNVLSDHVGGVSFPACTGKSEAAPSGQPRIPRRWKGREPLCPDRLCLCSGFMARHSRLQREVLGLYRQFLRACRGKPGFLPRVQAEFRRGARIPRTDVLLIEYLLRRGQRQLAQLREGHATRMGFFAPGRLQQQQQEEKGEDAQS